MKKIFSLAIFVLGFQQFTFSQSTSSTHFPDGTKIPEWFTDTKKIQLKDLGKAYVITDYGVVNDSTLIQTQNIQKVIDKVSKKGGGVIVIPKGSFLSGALFFKPKTHLHLEEGSRLKGSDTIVDYPIMPSRMEGKNLDYYPALINAYGVNGFSISGKGTIDGNGAKYWKEFWQRRKENPKCTNLEVSRPRLVFIWNSNNVQIQDVRLINSGFWTNHFYKCNNIKILDSYIYAPSRPIKSPSTDAIDLDVCENVLIKGCTMQVNDDAITLKGGKGPYADNDPNNGVNKNIIIENCTFGYCHSVLTNGSESVHNRNVIMRNCEVNGAVRLLLLKMRPDTPQLFEYIKLENIKGQTYNGLEVSQWTQFYDLEGRQDIPISYGDHITLNNINLKCSTFFEAKSDPNVKLSNFTFENLTIETKNAKIDRSLVKNLTFKNVLLNNRLIE